LPILLLPLQHQQGEVDGLVGDVRVDIFDIATMRCVAAVNSRAACRTIVRAA